MGIVNENGIGPGHGDHLHPALHPVDAAQGGGQLFQGQLQAQSGGQGRQGVVNGEAPGDGQMDPGDVAQGHRLELHVAGEQADVPGR